MAKMAKWRRRTEEFKRQAVESMKTCQNITKLAIELDVQRKQLYTWKGQIEGRPEVRRADLSNTTEDRKEKQLKDEIAKLKAALADKTVEIDFFRKALLKVREGRRQSIESGGTASTTSSNRGRQSKAH
jgi:transposase-like protein